MSAPLQHAARPPAPAPLLGSPPPALPRAPEAPARAAGASLAPSVPQPAHEEVSEKRTGAQLPPCLISLSRTLLARAAPPPAPAALFSAAARASASAAFRSRSKDSKRSAGPASMSMCSRPPPSTTVLPSGVRASRARCRGHQGPRHETPASHTKPLAPSRPRLTDRLMMNSASGITSGISSTVLHQTCLAVVWRAAAERRRWARRCGRREVTMVSCARTRTRWRRHAACRLRARRERRNRWAFADALASVAWRCWTARCAFFLEISLCMRRRARQGLPAVRQGRGETRGALGSSVCKRSKGGKRVPLLPLRGLVARSAQADAVRYSSRPPPSLLRASA